MSVNLYNKAYASMKESLPQFKNPEEALSFYLEGASKYLAKAEKAAQENRIEDRSNLSDKALLIFSGILSHLEQSSAEEKKNLKPLIEYCYSMNELILRMNMKNSVEMAGSLASEVKRMADHWKAKSEDVFLNIQHKNERAAHARAQESSAQSIEAPHLTSTTNDMGPSLSYPKSSHLSTADFSA
tara:strand:- start:33 stop:587 length:555 start_codon:yes stop_codon:yes gene_type:complete